MIPSYTYRADFLRNYDGDTIDFLVDLGFSTYSKIKVRLADVDTYEMRGGTAKTKELAKMAQKYVEDRLSKAEMIIIVTEKDAKGKYGRYVARVYYGAEGTTVLRNLNQELLETGLAVPY